MKYMFFSWGPHRGNHRFLWVILTVWLSFWAHRTSAQVSVVPAVVTAAVGDNVTLHVQGFGVFLTYSWYRGAETNIQKQILAYFPGSPPTQSNGAQHTGRETGLSDCSLHITNARTADTGLYTVTVQLKTNASQASGQLRVYDALSKPGLVTGIINSGSAVSGRNFTLQCMVGKDQLIDQYTFAKDNVNLTCDQKRISCNETSPILNFHPVEEPDRGNYTCTISNPISRNTSAALEIKVTVAISNVTLRSNVTSVRLWEKEDSVLLTCSSLGTDPVYSWTYNGSLLPQEHPEYQLSSSNSSLTIRSVLRSDTGPFVCNASNIANTESSHPLSLNISWRPNGMIQCGAEESGDRILLSCSWPGGNPSATVLLKQSTNVNKTEFNEVMSNVSKSDISPGTNLTCRGDQEGRTDECFLLFAPPQAPGFMNGSMKSFPQGSNVPLKVNLKSSSRASPVDILQATFTWFNNSFSQIVPSDKYNVTSDMFSSQLTIFKLTEADSGDYFCRAVNFMGTTSFAFVVNVSVAPETTTTPTTRPGTKPSDPPAPRGLSAGAIAGIVLAVLAVLVLISVTVYCCLKKKKGKQLGDIHSSAAGHKPADIPYTNMSEKSNAQESPNAIQLQETPQKDDVNYAALKFNNNQREPPSADYPGDTETTYAEVKKN